MSAAPVRIASAHREGTVKDKSYFPASGPFVKPQTSGAVFKYCTIDMRSFCKLEVSRFHPSIADGIFLRANRLLL